MTIKIDLTTNKVTYEPDYPVEWTKADWEIASREGRAYEVKTEIRGVAGHIRAFKLSSLISSLGLFAFCSKRLSPHYKAFFRNEGKD